eukprot:274217-Chlamydomonas_euryale.AAC.5
MGGACLNVMRSRPWKHMQMYTAGNKLGGEATVQPIAVGQALSKSCGKIAIKAHATASLCQAKLLVVYIAFKL